MRMQRASAPSKASTGLLKQKGILKSTRLPRTPEMFERGLLKPGDVLTILKRENSQAVVVDGSKVRYGDQIMSYNEWGEKVTGWSSLNIYKWVLLKGKMLGELRKKIV